MNYEVRWLYRVMFAGYTIGKDQGRFRWRHQGYWYGWLNAYSGESYPFIIKYLNPYKEWR